MGGLVAGGAVGTTVGATTGGALGFGTYTKRAEIKAGIEKAKEVAVYLAARAYAKAKNLKKQVFVRIGSIRDMVEKKVGGSQVSTPTSSSAPILSSSSARPPPRNTEAGRPARQYAA